jgi:hypothetical protein
MRPVTFPVAAVIRVRIGLASLSLRLLRCCLSTQANRGYGDKQKRGSDLRAIRLSRAPRFSPRSWLCHYGKLTTGECHHSMIRPPMVLYLPQIAYSA